MPCSAAFNQKHSSKTLQSPPWPCKDRTLVIFSSPVRKESLERHDFCLPIKEVSNTSACKFLPELLAASENALGWLVPFQIPLAVCWHEEGKCRDKSKKWSLRFPKAHVLSVIKAEVSMTSLNIQFRKWLLTRKH